jgi:hypothetical protein
MPAEPKNQRMKTANVRLCQYYFEQERMSIRLSLAVALAIYLAHWNSHPGWTGFCWLLLIAGIQLMRLWHLGKCAAC